MDAFDKVTTIPGSRYPIHLPAFPDPSSSSSSSSSQASTDITSNHSSDPIPFQRSRRKPAKVFKSPSADEPAESQGLNVSRKRATPPYEKPSPRQSSAETGRSPPPSLATVRRTAAQRKLPMLSLYHPLGPLAQSLPELDPELFGLPNSLNIEDPDDQGKADAGGRSTSRGQRPAQKPREREIADGDTQSNGAATNGSGKPGEDAPTRNPSPRKRRGGGAKRKRNADDGDTAFPPPAKRTRNPRGANNIPAAPSPLVSEAVVASDLVEDSAEGNAEAEEEAQEEAPQAPKRSARTRKPRTRPAKRRGSSGSASTSTSVSISIAATTKSAAAAKAEAEPAVESGLVEAEPEAPTAAEPEKEEPVPQEDTSLGEKQEGNEVVEPPATHQDLPAEELSATAAPPAHAPMKHEESQPKASQPPTPSYPPPPAHPASSSSVSLPQKEEREEGELSDDGPGN
ncbi:hypothetical protein BD414DRAFT_497258 [Trametes punicea]|nr:hypothetical protein BD414DRAFT_497258 [Trametes punicea]